MKTEYRSYCLNSNNSRGDTSKGGKSVSPCNQSRLRVGMLLMVVVVMVVIMTTMSIVAFWFITLCNLA
jgi:hypothetical protein